MGKKSTTEKPTEKLPLDEMRPDPVLVEHPIDLPGPTGTKPSMILVFECDQCKAHAYMEVDDLPDLRVKKTFTTRHVVSATNAKRENGRLKEEGCGLCGSYRFARGFVQVAE